MTDRPHDDASPAPDTPASDAASEGTGRRERTGTVRRTKPRRRWLWRWTRRILIFLVVAYVTRALWLGPILASVASSVLTDELGAPVQIDAIEGSYFGGLTILGVRIGDATPDVPVQSLYVGRVDATVDLFKLVTGRADWLGPFVVADTSVELDLRGKDDPDRVDKPPDGLPDEFPVDLPPLQLRNVRVRMKADDNLWLELDGVNSTGHRGADGYELELSCTAIRGRIQDADFAPEPGQLRATIGRREIRLESGFTDDPREISTGRGLRGMTARISDDKPHTFVFAGTIAAFGGAILVEHCSITIAPDEQVLDAAVQLQDLDGAVLLDIMGDNFPVTRGHVSGPASCRIDLTRPLAMDARATLAITDASVIGLDVDHLQVDAGINAGESFANLTASVGDSAVSIDVSDAGLFLPSVNDGRDIPPVNGRVRVALRDVAAARDLLTPGFMAVLGAQASKVLFDVLDPARLSGAELVVNAGIEDGRELAADVQVRHGDGTQVQATATMVLIARDPVTSSINGSVTVRAPDVYKLRVWHPEIAALDPHGQLDLHATVGGTLDALELAATVNAQQLRLHDLPEINVQVEGAWQNERIELPVCRITCGDDRVVAAMMVDHANGVRVERLYADVDVHELGEYARLLGMAPGELTGSVRATATGTLAHDSSTIGDAQSPAATVPRSRVALQMRRVHLGALAIPRARLDAVVTATSARVESLDLHSSHGTLGLQGGVDFADPAAIALDLQRFEIGWRHRMAALESPTRVVVRPVVNPQTRPAGDAPPTDVYDTLPGISVDPPLALAGPYGRLELWGQRDSSTGAGTLTLLADLHDLTDLRARLGIPGPGPDDLQLDVQLTDGLMRLATHTQSLRLHDDLPAFVVHLEAELTRTHLDVSTLRVDRADRTRPADGGERSPGPDQPANEPLISVTASLPFNPAAPTPILMFPARAADRFGLRGTLHAESLETLVSAALPDVKPSGSVDASVELTGSWAAPEVLVRVESTRLEFLGLTAQTAAAAGIPLRGPQADLLGNLRAVSLDVTLRYAADSLRVERVSLTIPDADAGIELDGECALAGDLRHVMTGIESFTPGVGEFRCTGRVGDLRRLPLPGGAVRSLSGSIAWQAAVSASEATAGEADGDQPATTRIDWTAPQIDASVTLADVSARVQGLPPLESIDAGVRFDGREFAIEQFEAELGAAPVAITGQCELLSNAIGMDISVTGQNVLLTRQLGVRIRADLAVRARGHLPTGTAAVSEPLTISGEVGLRDSRVATLIDFYGLSGGSAPGVARKDLVLFTIPDKPMSDVRLDGLSVYTQPGDTLELSTNVLKGEVGLALTLNGTLQVPEPAGSVSFRSGSVSLPAASLTLQTAQVRFEESRPFDPTVTVFATTYMRGYDISVSFNGRYTQLADMEVNLASDPTLDPEDLSLLLLTGKPPEQAIGSKSATNAAANFAVYFGKDLVNRLLSGDDSLDDEGESVFDRIEVEIGKELSRTGNETIEVRFRLLDNLFTDSDKLLLEGERDIYDEYNGGVALRFRFR